MDLLFKRKIQSYLQLYFPPILKELIYNFYDYNLKSKPYLETEVLKCLCPYSKVALDIGSNNGQLIPFMMRRARQIIAFEPLPNLAKRLRTNFPSQSVIVHQCALSDREVMVDLRIPLLDGKELVGLSSIETSNTLIDISTKIIKAECKTLDSFNLENVGFIKIDVEGHELGVLQGAEKTIASSQPNFLIEVEERHREGAIESIKQFFYVRDYKGFFICDNKLLPLERFNIVEHQNPKNIGIDKKLPGAIYINDLIFIPTDKIAKIFSKYLS